jgi:hypothetical protein
MGSLSGLPPGAPPLAMLPGSMGIGPAAQGAPIKGENGGSFFDLFLCGRFISSFSYKLSFHMISVQTRY